MATRIHVGAKQLKSTLAAYAKRFDLLEVHADTVGEGGPTPVTTVSLRRWRKQVPPHFEFCVVAGRAVSALKPGEALDRGIEELKRVAFALEARVLVLPTPTEVTPAVVWRDRMRRLLDRLPLDATQAVWEPHGVWEPDDAALAAARWGIVLAVDASRSAVPDGPVAYVRLRALGERRSFGPAAMERVVRAIDVRRDAYVILETDGALAECRTLRRLAQGMPQTRDAGGRVLARPGLHGLQVRDDEQE